MKKVIGIMVLSILLSIRFFIETMTNIDTDVQFWSRVSTTILIICLVLVLIRMYRVNVIHEIRTALKFKQEPAASQESLKILFGGTVLPILFGAFVLAPVISFSLIKINETDVHKSNLLKNKIVKTYQSGGRKKLYVDTYYDGKPITLRISHKVNDYIKQYSQLPNLNRGRLGFYFIED